MQFPNFLATGPRASAFEVSAISYSVAYDVRNVLNAAEPASPELSELAARAIVSLDVALREAAGSPADGRWCMAYESLAAFIERYARHSHGTGASDALVRLSNFLAENADLVASGAEKVEPFPSALAHARG